MNSNHYQLQARRTLVEKAPELGDSDKLIVWILMGLAGETGELVDSLKKGIYHKHGIDYEKVAYEIGDVLWYLTSLATNLDYTLSEIMHMNITKLRKRYPNGFSSEDSLKRVDTLPEKSLTEKTSEKSSEETAPVGQDPHNLDAEDLEYYKDLEDTTDLAYSEYLELGNPLFLDNIKLSPDRNLNPNLNLNPDPDPNIYEEFVNHPVHYNSHPKGIECIDIIEDMDRVNIALAIKHLWRLGKKGENTEIQDLEKAIWYLVREKQRILRNTI